MYIPHAFAVADLDRVAADVARAGAGELVTVDGNRPVSSRIPLLWEREGDELGRVVGHLARANPQWLSIGPDSVALVIVPGPGAYVSPSSYPSTAEHGRMVPTWNYTSVHLTGPVQVHDDPDWVRDLVTRLTDHFEASRDPAWRVTDAPADFIAGQLRAIVGIEVRLSCVEAKDKLSQNRKPVDQRGALADLSARRGDPGAAAVARLMRRTVPPVG